MVHSNLVVTGLSERIIAEIRSIVNRSSGLPGGRFLFQGVFQVWSWIARLHDWRNKIFWAEFERSVEVDRESGCWNWRGRYSEKGYGVFRGRLAFKVAWFARGREKEFGLSLHHACFNKRCVNPDHLVEIPREEHMKIHGEHWRALRRADG